MFDVATTSVALNKESDGYFRCRWVDDQGRRHSRSFGVDRKEATRRFTDFQYEWTTDPRVRNPDDAVLTINMGWTQFETWAKAYYVAADGTPTGEATNMADATDILREMFGDDPAETFGVVKLGRVQAQLVVDDLAVNTINARVRKIGFFFRWLASKELVPSSLPESLRTLLPVKAGRAIDVGGGVMMVPRSTAPVQGVPAATIAATKMKLPDVVADMIDFQLLTSCRPQDVCNLTLAQLDRGGKVWLYYPEKHKKAHLGLTRVVCIGPKAQAILQRYLSRDINTPVFSPREAMRQRLDARIEAYEPPDPTADYRRTPSYKARRAQGTLAQYGTKWKPQAYGLAIRNAAEEADVPHWSPNQLRHTAGTQIRREHGLEGAQVMLGHAHMSVTEIYAEKNLALAIEIAEKVG